MSECSLFNGWKFNDNVVEPKCKVSGQLQYADKRIDETLNEKLLFVRRHILHDLLPMCFTFGPEHGIVDGLNVSMEALMHSTLFS